MNSPYTDKSIKYYRKKLKIKQSELALILGITNTDMSFIENKKLYPPSGIAEKIAETLKVPVGALWKECELDLILDKNNN